MAAPGGGEGDVNLQIRVLTEGIEKLNSLVQQLGGLEKIATSIQQSMGAVTQVFQAVGEATQSLGKGIQEVGKDTRQMRTYFGEIKDTAKEEAEAIKLINLRDFASSIAIQSQRIIQSFNEMMQTFGEMETVTQQITILDQSMKGMRREVDLTATAISIKFGVATLDVATALKEVTALGISFADATEIVRVGAMGAAAGMGTLENASNLLITTQRQFGLSVGQSEQIMAKLVFIANETAFNIDNMTESMALAGPMAGQMGFSIEETAAAMSLMRDVGIDASMAGTALRQFLVRLQDPTAQAQALFEDLGIQVTDDAGNFLDLVTILRNVFEATENLDAAQRSQVLATLFEVRGEQLVNVTRARGADYLEDLINETGRFNDKQTASAYLTEKSNEAMDTNTRRLQSAQNQTDAYNRIFAEALIPGQIEFLKVQNAMKGMFAAMPEWLRGPIGELGLFTAQIGNAFGQTVFLLVNLTTLKKAFPLGGVVKKITEELKLFRIDLFNSGGVINMLKDKLGGLATSFKGTRAAAFGLGFTVAALATTMAALTTDSSDMRLIFSALTAVEIGLAAASFLAAAGMMSLQAAATVGVAAVAIGAAIYYLGGVLSEQRAKFSQPINMQHGGLFNPRPKGTIVRVAEAGQKEVISPIPMMKETFREVIEKEQAKQTSPNIVFAPEFHVAPFTTIDPSMTSILMNVLSKDLLKELRRKGTVTA